MKTLATIVMIIIVTVKAAYGLFDSASADVKAKAEDRLAQIDKATK